MHIIADSTAEAREQLIDALERDRADRGLTDATQQAAEAVQGLVDDGPAKLVTTEIAALIRRAEQAETRAARWQQASDALDDLYVRQRTEHDQAAQTNDEAKRHVELVRSEVAEPLTAQAAEALTDWQAADTAEKKALDKVRAAGMFKKRRAIAEHDTAQGTARSAKRKLTKAWGEPPRWNENQAAWVERVTRPRIEADPRVIEAEQQRATAAHALHAALEPNPCPAQYRRLCTHLWGRRGEEESRCLRQRPTCQTGRGCDPHCTARPRRGRGAARAHSRRGGRADQADSRIRGNQA